MKTKEIIVCVLILIVLAFAASEVYGMDILNQLNETTTNQNVGNISGQNTNNTPIISGGNNNTSNTNNTNSNVTGLPSTGIDYSVVLIIAICSVSAIYAYKKIKDYNIK